MDNRPISEQYHKAALEWVDAESAANLLEDTKSAVLSQKMLAKGVLPVNKAELLVKGDPEWQDYLIKINNARTHANRLKVQVEYMRMKFQEWISADANKRVQDRLLREVEMECAFVVGQKVTCIAAFKEAPFPIPVEGETYTIREIRSHHDGIGVLLVEIRNVPYPTLYGVLEISFIYTGFRPLTDLLADFMTKRKQKMPKHETVL